MERDTPSPAAADPPAPAAAHVGPPQRAGDRALPWVLLVAAVGVGALLAAFRANRDGAVADPHSTTAAAAGAAADAWTPAPRPTGEVVSLTIDFGNGARREFAALPYAQGMTLGDLMDQARTFRPPVVFTQQGEGESAFLTSLEGVANETGANGRYWLYSVDGRHGEVSFAVQSLAAGVAVLWEFRRGE
jgi:hypothetical protein